MVGPTLQISTSLRVVFYCVICAALNVSSAFQNYTDPILQTLTFEEASYFNLESTVTLQKLFVPKFSDSVLATQLRLWRALHVMILASHKARNVSLAGELEVLVSQLQQSIQFVHCFTVLSKLATQDGLKHLTSPSFCRTLVKYCLVLKSFALLKADSMEIQEVQEKTCSLVSN